MLHLFEHVDTVRKEVGQQISQKRKSELGQFNFYADVFWALNKRCSNDIIAYFFHEFKG